MTIACIIDVETTGLDPNKDAVCELAVVVVDAHDGEIIARRSTYVDPRCPIPPEISAIHHITDEHVRGAPDLEYAWKWCFGDLTNRYDPDVFVAHNAAFDSAFLASVAPKEVPWLCTYRTAAHVYPDAPGHSNQVLRYYLELRDPLSDLPPHRALPDAEVTARLFLHLIMEVACDPPYVHDDDLLSFLLDMQHKPILQKRIRFGEHRGKLWSEVPRGYLNWILGKDFDDDVKHTARVCLEART